MNDAVNNYVESIRKNKNRSSIAQMLLEVYIAKKQEQNAKHHEHMYNEFGASSAGGCIRKRYYDKIIQDKTKRHSINTLKIFLVGDMFHSLFQEHILVGGQKEVQAHYKINDIVIRCDADYIDEAVIWELKTVSSIKYVIDKPNLNNLKQLNLYLGIFERPLGKIVYIDKRFFSIIEHDVIFDKKLFDETIDEYLILWKHIKTKTLPEKEEDEIGCRRCNRKDLCKVNKNVE